MVELEALDVGYLALFTGFAFGDAVLAELVAAGYGDLRFSHGFVVQHLIEAPRTIGELAERMAVTQQGASKSVGELERLGYVERRVGPEDARVRKVQLTKRGRAAVERTRKIRAAIARKLERNHGAREVAECRRVLSALLESLGGVEAIKRRRVTAPR